MASKFSIPTDDNKHFIFYTALVKSINTLNVNIDYKPISIKDTISVIDDPSKLYIVSLDEGNIFIIVKECQENITIKYNNKEYLVEKTSLYICLKDRLVYLP